MSGDWRKCAWSIMPENQAVNVEIFSQGGGGYLKFETLWFTSSDVGWAGDELAKSVSCQEP